MADVRRACLPLEQRLILMGEGPRARRHSVLSRIHTDDVPPAQQQRWLPLKIRTGVARLVCHLQPQQLAMAPQCTTFMVRGLPAEQSTTLTTSNHTKTPIMTTLTAQAMATTL